MICITQLAEHFSVRPDATQTGAGKVHAMVALVSRDKTRFGGLALASPVGSREFQRRIRAFRTGVGE